LPGPEKSGWSFAGFRLDADGVLFRGETPVHLPPKELAALQLLLANAGRIVSPLQLRQALWGDVHVTADSVPKCVSSLRARLDPEDCIQTIYKRGYRFTAAVRNHGEEPGGTLPRLAILPFSCGFGVPDHLGSVLAEEAMVRLSGMRPAIVSILAQDSVFTLARRGMTAVETGEALGADFVLAGSLRALPMHYRLRAEMIRVEGGIQVWVEDLLVERDRIAGLEAELVNRLVFRLSASSPRVQGTQEIAPVSPISDGVPASKRTQSAASRPLPRGRGLAIAAVAEPTQQSGDAHQEAYETYQRAHHEWQTLQRHRMQDGLQHLLRATELDPSLIGARVDLVNLCVTQSLYGFMSPTVAADIVRRTAESIPDLTTRAEAILPALGWVRFHVDRDLPAALWAFSLSAHLPHDPWTTRVRAIFALSRRRFGEALDLLRSAIQLDPYSPWLQARLGWALHLAGETSGSVDQIRNALRQFPDHEGANLYGALILAFNGEAARANELAERLAQRVPYFDLATAVHAYALANLGRGDEARAILERLQWLGRERFLLRAFTPIVCMALGEPDAALAELCTSNENRCPWFFQILADPQLKPLHSRPEFLEMQTILPGMEAEAARNEEALA
jgi:DNA-binding winged helix-turn-helix (wHTH) protein/tetratricopeptide (TPR) repeat protein